MTIPANRIERYYDIHEPEELDLTQGRIHFFVIKYLISVLEWFFNNQQVGIASEIRLYQTANPNETPVSPDLCVVDGLELIGPVAEDNPSYWVGEHGPPPRVVIEVTSKKTWESDLKLDEKRGKYFSMQVNEYFVFDYHRKSIWRGDWARHKRLVGWRRDPQTGEYQLLEKDEAGRLWSEELQSWLVIEEAFLRLYTKDGQLRLTQGEALNQQLLLEQAALELERARAEQERQRAEQEWARAEQERQRAEQERQRAQVAENKLAKLMEELRRRGENPDDLL